MKITNDLLIKLGACSGGKEWFNSQKETSGVKIVSNFLETKEHLDWANWLICQLFNRKQKIQYAVFAADGVHQEKRVSLIILQPPETYDH